MPDEIDGDDRLGVLRRSGLFHSEMLKASTGTEEQSFSMDDSMYIEDVHDPLSIAASSLSDAQQERLKRYSVIGNDPSFKQYTKNHDYDAIKYQSS